MDALATELAKQLDMVVTKGSAFVKITAAELVKREIFYSIMNSIALLLFLILCIVGIFFLLKSSKKVNYDFYDDAFLQGLGVLALIICVLILALCLFDSVQAIYAWSHFPNIQVTEYVLQGGLK